MTRRRTRWNRNKPQRTLLQIAILTTVLAFIALDSPAVRASVNATLVWLAIRGLILGAAALAIMWTYQFCRPPKVRRRKSDGLKIKRKTGSSERSVGPSLAPTSRRAKSRIHERTEPGTPEESGETWPDPKPSPRHASPSLKVSKLTPPMPTTWHEDVNEPLTRDKLLNSQLSGVRSFSHTDGDEDW